MHFDKLCYLAERYDTLFGDNPYDGMQVLRILRKAHLFDFRSIDSTNDSELPVDVSYFVENPTNFVLPFDVCCVEDRDGCTVICRCCEEHKARQEQSPKGLLDSFGVFFLSLADIKLPQSGYVVGMARLDVRDLLSAGFNYVMNVMASAIMTHDLEDGLTNVTEQGGELREEFGEHATFRTNWAMRCIMYINSPKHFILETASTRPYKIGPKLPRSHQRPSYTVLRPYEARRLMRLPSATEGEHGTKAPHERRRHLRTLRSEHFVHKQGQTIVIPSCWIGPKENVVGNKRYRVMTEL